MGNSCSPSSKQRFHAPMETPRQSNVNVEKCSEACTETSSQSTNLCQLEKMTESDKNKITNELNPDKYVLFCTECHSPLSRKDTEQHKLHDVQTLKKAADDDLLRKEESSTKELQNFQNNLNEPSFDQEGESVENSLIQAFYSQEEKEKIQQKEKEHEQLRMEREYFEKAFETVMALVKSLVNYRGNKGEKKENLKFHLPKVPEEIEKTLKKKMKKRRTAVNDELKRLKNIAVEIIDIERQKEQDEIKSSEKRNNKDATHESTTTGSETQLEETKETTQTVKDQNERMRNVITTINKWINTCHKIVKQSEVDKIELNLPSEDMMSEKGKQTLETNRKKLEDICQLLSETLKKLGQIEKEKNYFEQLLHGSFTWLHSVPESEGEYEIEITLPDVPMLDDEKRIQDLNKDRDEKQNVLKNIKTILNEHQQMVKECVKLRKIQLEKNFYESSFKGTFQTLTSILQSSHRTRMKLPEIPELQDETKHQEMEEERKDAINVLKDLKHKIFEEGKKLKQMGLEKNYFEKACKQILATLTSTLESRHNINIRLPELPELEDETKSQEIKEERKKAKDVLKKLLTKDNKEDLKRLKNKLQEAEDKADRAVFEREKTLTRLSEIAGSRLRENNPMIADLSDDNRPTKLGEKHGELYDNEWTDAFQIITTKLKKSDIIAIEMLLELLKDIYYTCLEMAQKQLNDFLCPMQLEESDEQIKVPGLLKKVKDFQKNAAPDMMIVVKEVMKTKSKKTKKRKFESELDLCESYIVSCIELCWMMNVQDPPVVLVFEEKNGEEINRSLFKPYTRSGKYTDYMVWPAMLLHEEGPLLQKGVVQPK